MRTRKKAGLKLRRWQVQATFEQGMEKPKDTDIFTFK
jgi:hypothetical protein